MALVVTISGNDRTSIVETDTIRIDQVADSFTFTASMSLYDEDGDIDITAGSHLDADEITIVDGATTYFGGYVVNQDFDAAEEDSRHLHLQCQGFGIKLNETLVEYEEYSNKADDWIINDLFDTYLAAFDSVTHVAQLDAGMDISFTEMTLAECMEAICQRTKGRWYIDNDKKIHYFAAEGNAVTWFLSDTPEAATENLITNPSFEVDTAGWTTAGGTLTRDVAEYWIGVASGKFVTANPGEGFYDDVTAQAAAGTEYTFSLWCKTAAATFRTAFYDNVSGFQTLTHTVPDAGWNRYTQTRTFGAGSVGRRVYPIITLEAVATYYIDGVQLEQKAAATSYCDGTRAGCTWAGTAHASTSDRIISYSFHADPTKQIDAAAIVNRVRVIGADDFAVTRNDATSQAAYGIRAGIITDQSLETTAAMEERGDDVLDKNKDPRITYTAKTFQDGAVAGMDIGFRCPPLDIDTEQVIRELNITWWMNEPSYELTLGTHAETSAISRAFYTGSTIRKIIVDPNIPMGSRGWGHDIPFAATDYRTVKWVAGGTITLAGGVGSFAIAANAGNSTGNMGATTYIYFDADISLTELQDDVDPANAIGANKILVAVAGQVADEDTNKAIFQVFGGAGTGVLIVADNIAADTITGNEIAANAIVAGHIQAAAIETDKIKAGAVVADKLSIGQTLFSNADGLLILNPPIRIEKPVAINYWYTLRGQKATLAGALHLEQGRWAGTKALVVEVAATNLLKNPSAGADPLAEWGRWGNNGTLTRDTTGARFGSAQLKMVTANAAANEGPVDNVTAETAAGTEYTFSIWVRGEGTVRPAFSDDVIGLQLGDVTTLTDTWQRLQVTATYNVGSAARYVVLLTSAQQDITFYADGAQLEAKDHATTYCDGSLGDGYAWTNGAHASTSTRAATEVDLDAHVGLITANDTVSFRVVVQMPYDADATWPTLDTCIWAAKGADANNRIYLFYDSFLNRIRVYINGDDRLWAAVSTFKAGDWLDLLITCDYANDDYRLYLAGVLEDWDDTSLTAPVLTAWNVGSTTAAASQGGFAFAEYSTFDRVLTAIEAAQLYNLQRPIIDTGATDTPGIYILDGRVRIQSSQTGVRIVIDAEEIAGYDGAGTKQFSLEAATGKAQCGAGEVILDDTGIIVAEVVKMGAGGTDIAITTAAADIRAYKFELAGTVMSGLFAYAADANSHVINLIAKEIAGRSPTIGIYADSPATTPAYISIKSDSAGNFAQVLLTADSDAAVKTKANINAERTEFSGTISTDASVNRWKLKGPHLGTYVGWVGYVEVEINGTTYKLTYGTWT